MEAKIDSLSVAAFQVPTDAPESDGTLEWDSTTMVVVEVGAGKERGLGFTYADLAAATLIQRKLRPVVLGREALDVQGVWEALVRSVRNLGSAGISAMAISAVDVAMWDLKARLLNLPLVRLLGQVRPGIQAYGSGGFTSYSLDRLRQQLGDWANAGLRSVKMKIGRNPEQDVDRVRAAREAIGPGTELFVDSNGAYSLKQALRQAELFGELNVAWFEEPVSSDDLAGLRFVRRRSPACMVIAAGEYGYDGVYFRRMLEAQAVDVLQADATRCAGITGFVQAGALCDAFQTPLSAHTAPSIHRHPCCAIGRACNVEYFYDHQRIEKMFFDGATEPVAGELRPDLSRPGLGLDFKRADAEKYEIR